MVKNSKLLKAVLTSALTLAVLSTSTTAFAESILVDTGTYIDVKSIFEEWVSYPDSSFGEAYDAGWEYNEEEDYINTSKNVGWTGFYNPTIDNLTTGTFAFEMCDGNFDPCGFAWGLTKSGTEEDPIYSFYAYEECHESNYWSIAYISEWHPAKSTSKHRGPLYHGTIDAADGNYDHTGKDADAVDFAEGTVLACGSLEEFELNDTDFHKVLIDIKEDTVSVSVNDTLLATVDAPVQAGSFGPFATSNPYAYFRELQMVSTNEVMLNPVFEYRNAENVAVNEAVIGEEITIANLSTFEGSEITEYNWTVKKDGEVIYTGTEPYTEYTAETGIYLTSLSLVNAYGIVSGDYIDILEVKEVPTEVPTEAPTQVATEAPTQAPTKAPTQAPTQASTQAATSTTSGKTVNTGNNTFAVSSVAVLATIALATVAVTGLKKRKEEK